MTAQQPKSIGFGILTWSRDQLMVWQCVRSIRLQYPRSPILVLDDANYPIKPLIARKLIELGATYRKSEWDRGPAQKQHTNFSSIHSASQIQTFSSFSIETNVDLFCKIDSDSVLTKNDLGVWLNDFELIMGADAAKRMVFGFCYVMRSRALQHVSHLLHAGRLATDGIAEDIVTRRLFQEAFGPERVLDYEPNRLLQGRFIGDWLYPDGGVALDENFEEGCKNTALNMGWLKHIDLPTIEAKRAFAATQMERFVDRLHVSVAHELCSSA